MHKLIETHLLINCGFLVHPSAFSKSSCSVCKSVQRNRFQTLYQSLSSFTRMPAQYTKLLRFAGILCICEIIIKSVLLIDYLFRGREIYENAYYEEKIRYNLKELIFYIVYVKCIIIKKIC